MNWLEIASKMVEQNNDGVKIAPLSNITQLSKFLSTTDKCVDNLCKRIGCPIIRAGAQKIRMVSRKTFFDALKGGED